MTAHKKYSDEFKADAVAKFKQAKQDGTPIMAVAKELGISDVLMHTWHAKATGRPVNKGKKKPKPKPEKKDHRTLPRQQYSIAMKQQMAAMVRTGMKAADVGRELGVPAHVVTYAARNGIQRGSTDDQALPVVAVPKAANGIGSGGAITDALIYLRHAEKEILEMIRDGKIARPDQAHLLTLLALGAVQKSIAK